MIKRKLFIVAVSLSCFLVAACGAGYFAWLVNSQTVARAEWEHGVVLPASVGRIACRGDATRFFLDRGASTVFDMDAADLSAFKSSLPPAVSFDTFVPGNAEYRGFAFPWTVQKPAETLSCESPTGDWLHVQIWPMQASRVGVWMYTDWN